MKKQGGITLVALVITIIVLLILATITIATLSNSGTNIITKAKDAKNNYEDAESTEKGILSGYNSAITVN